MRTESSSRWFSVNNDEIVLSKAPLREADVSDTNLRWCWSQRSRTALNVE